MKANNDKLEWNEVNGLGRSYYSRPYNVDVDTGLSGIYRYLCPVSQTNRRKRKDELRKSGKVVS